MTDVNIYKGSPMPTDPAIPTPAKPATAEATRRCTCWLGTDSTFGDSAKRQACAVHGDNATPLPCPFCGVVPEVRQWGTGYWSVQCLTHVSIGGVTRADAIAHWNTRAPDPTLAAVVAERDALLLFKQYVHKRLDDAGVTVDPDSPHKAEGCRIGGRLDEVLGERDALAKGIADAAVKAGIITDQNLTGPQLLLLCDDLATAASRGDATAGRKVTT